MVVRILDESRLLQFLSHVGVVRARSGHPFVDLRFRNYRLFGVEPQNSVLRHCGCQRCGSNRWHGPTKGLLKIARVSFEVLACGGLECTIDSFGGNLRLACRCKSSGDNDPELTEPSVGRGRQHTTNGSQASEPICSSGRESCRLGTSSSLGLQSHHEDISDPTLNGNVSTVGWCQSTDMQRKHCGLVPVN